MDANDRQFPTVVPGAAAAAAMMFSPTGAGAGTAAWFSPQPAMYIEELYKQYQQQQQTVVAACPSPSLTSMASPVGWPSTPSLHGAPTYIASPGSPLPPSFSFLTPTGFSTNRSPFPRQQQQQQVAYRTSTMDAEIQCCISEQMKAELVNASTQTIADTVITDAETVDSKHVLDDEEEYVDVELDEDTKDGLDLSLITCLSKQQQQQQFNSSNQQQQRQIGIVRGRLRSEEPESMTTESASDTNEVSPATVVEAKSGAATTRGQRQWDILCAVAGLLQQVDLLQLEPSCADVDANVEQVDNDDNNSVNSVDNLGCRYDTRPVSRVNLGPDAPRRIPDAKDCEQLVAQIEALWRRIQQSRLNRKPRGGCSSGSVAGTSRYRHRSDVVLTAPASSSSAASAGSSDPGDGFSPYASSVHMLAFCASEQRPSTVGGAGSDCPTIDRITSTTSDAPRTTVSSKSETAKEFASSSSSYPLSPNSATTAAAVTAHSATISSSVSSGSVCGKKRRYRSSSSGGSRNRNRSNSGGQRQSKQEQQKQQQQQQKEHNDAGPPTPELRSCQLAENDLRDGQRVLVGEANVVDGGGLRGGGLWYSGVLREVRPPDVYRVSLNGSPRSRHQYFTREELLCQAVLEIRPSSLAELPIGCRVCAYWSASLTALYPGTVRSHQISDEEEEEDDDDEESFNVANRSGQEANNIDELDAGSDQQRRRSVYIEFDDNDSRWIPLDRIRMLPPGLPAPVEASAAASSASGRQASSPCGVAKHRRRHQSSTSTLSATAETPVAATFEWADVGKRSAKFRRRRRHRSLLRNGEPINVGDAVMFKSTSIDRPFYGRVVDMWEEEAPAGPRAADDADDDEDDNEVGGSVGRRMWVEAAWFYQPAEMPDNLGRRFRREQGRALFLSGHRDRNEARTILRKLPLSSYAKSVRKSSSKSGSKQYVDSYFFAGEYDASGKRIIRLDPDYESALLAREAEKRLRKQQKKKRLLAAESASKR